MSIQTDARLKRLLQAAQGGLIGGDPATAPSLSRPLVEYLEATYPPKCHDPSAETLGEHLLYAGRVALVQDLRAILDAQGDADSLDEDRYPAEAPLEDWEGAERAGGDN